MNLSYEVSDIHEDIREATAPEGMSKDDFTRVVGQIRANLPKLNVKLDRWDEDEDGNNVHPQRYEIRQKGKTAYVLSSDEARAAFNPGTVLTEESLGF